MDSKTLKQLEHAKSLFYSWQLVEAYHILRRYFDRIPFQPEDEHAEYIGMFIRTLTELGKASELRFHVLALEKHLDRVKSPAILYQLAYLYMELPEPRGERARQMFESILQDPNAKTFHAKAKMMLAAYYDSVHDDMHTCRMYIDSIHEPLEGSNQIFLEIWKARLFRVEKKYVQALLKYESIFKSLTSRIDWYAYFSAKLGLAFLYIETKKLKLAKGIANEIRDLIQGRQFKSIQSQLKKLDAVLEGPARMGSISFLTSPNESTLSHSDKTLVLKRDSSGEKILNLLIENHFLDKEELVRKLYDRTYLADRDDPLIYYHIYALRRRLKKLGLPANAIKNEGKGYRWIPKVEV